LSGKHRLSVEEVEEALLSGALFRRVRRGRIKGEDVFLAYGRTLAGRYLLVVFVFKKQETALVISARDMTGSEERYYDARKAKG